MKSLTAQQLALFEAQKWHLRRALENEADARRVRRWLDRKHGQLPVSEILDAWIDRIRNDYRRAKLHRKFVDAITPFLMAQ